MQISEAAVVRAKQILIENNKVGHGLRIGVSTGGCSGLSYRMDFEEKPTERDKVLEFDGLKVFVDPKAYLYLSNVEIGWHSDLLSSNFTFHNPDAKTTCGCGTSFSV
jgi:iron-sulfur cluster assembly protein